MKIITTPSEMSALSLSLKQEGKSIAVVPTMGALHQGHLALVDKAVEIADVVVVTLFVNPMQFNESSDYDSYPRTFDEDCSLAQFRGASIIYAPTVASMYPKGYCTKVQVSEVTKTLEGAARPGHFDGVTTVVLKLFTATLPNYALFGQKDAQQLLVITKMVEDLNFPVDIIAFPTVRAESGLALSSRNTLLTQQEQKSAPLIYQGLLKAKACFDRGERRVEKLEQEVRVVLEQTELLSVEYIAFSDRNCAHLPVLNDEGLISIACVCKESGVRLIDNMALGNFWF